MTGRVALFSVITAVDRLDSAHSNIVVVEIDLGGSILREADLNALTNVLGRDFIADTMKGERGVASDGSLEAYEKELVQSLFIDSLAGIVSNRDLVAINGPSIDPVVDTVVIFLPEPLRESLVERLEIPGGVIADIHEKPFANTSKKPLNLAS
jgi:hypothetical protein